MKANRTPPNLWLTGGIFLILIVSGGYYWRQDQIDAGDSRVPPSKELEVQTPSLPALFSQDIPESCRQLLLVMSPHPTSIPATLYLMERRDGGSPWEPVSERGVIPVTLGRSGLAWGVGEHHATRPVEFREKREGDGCSPAGVFRVPFTFGIDSVAEAHAESPGLKLPYTALEDSIIGVDDPKSKYYNQVVNSTTVTRDWDSHEPMNRYKRLYRWGAFIAHNPEGVPGFGSCIFIHVWPGPGEPTAGCTGMADPDVVRVLTWLDPSKEPRLVQWVETVDSLSHEGSAATPTTVPGSSPGT